jgi:tripartite-type tricarboxylate transporter receptor subunit TctC
MRGRIEQPIIIENVGGAEGSIGVGRAARARPDGYTLCVGTLGTHVQNGAFYSLSYDVLHGFVPIIPLASIPFVLFARKSIPADNLKDLVAWLRAHTDQASAGMNSLSQRLLAAFFQKQTGTQFVIVPYRAAVSVIEDLVAGRTDLAIDTPIRLPLVRSGNIKAYAVTSETRLAVAPDIPTFAEMGLPALSYSQWYGLFAPTGTPQSIVDKLKFAAGEALADPVVPARLVPFGMELFPRERQTAEALAAMQKADAEKWWPIIKESAVRAE